MGGLMRMLWEGSASSGHPRVPGGDAEQPKGGLQGYHLPPSRSTLCRRRVSVCQPSLHGTLYTPRFALPSLGKLRVYPQKCFILLLGASV